MKSTILTAAAIAVTAVNSPTALADTVTSPDGAISVNVDVNSQGEPFYSVTYKGKPVVTDSRLGLVGNEASLGMHVTMTASPVKELDETWTPVWGEYSQVRSHCNERLFSFTEKSDPKLKLDLRVRVFDDGVGFRYEVPEHTGVNYLQLMDELTEIAIPGDPTMWAIPGDYDTDEYLYATTPRSELAKNLNKPNHSEATLIPGLAVQTPVLLKLDGDGPYVNIHEAALTGYPAMALDVDSVTGKFTAHLTPDMNGVRGFLQAPFVTPWRTLIISDDARDILASQLIYNLNEPCAIEDTSWIKPGKFIGVWWEMFTGNQKTWAYSDAYDAKPGITDYTKLTPNGRHPANTANVMKYIDFAAETGIPSVLVEGWNEGWEDWANYRKNRQYLFDKAYPDFDVDSLHRYAASKGVKLIMHHETAANAADYERQLDRAFQFMKDNGYDAVKTGYVGYIIPRSERHSSQWMVDHYLHVAKRAADYGIMVDSHEAVRPTGMARTWPNWIAQESARGGEYEAMSGNTPDHTLILPFTRIKGGPFDYTPGLFESDLATYGEGKTNKGSTTLAKQLALYVTMPSPLQMACDLPDTYRKYMDAFRFIQDVPVDWADSRYLEAAPGDYITVARKDKASDDWYVGAATDENARTAIIDMSFLDPGREYIATIYADAPDASWDKNPKAYKITTRKVNSKTRLKQPLAPGGGAALRIAPATTANGSAPKAKADGTTGATTR